MKKISESLLIMKKEDSVSCVKILECSLIENDKDSSLVAKKIKFMITMQSKLLVPCEFEF